MRLLDTIELYAYGTSEGVKKAWDLRPRAQVHVLDPHSPIMRLELRSNPGDAPILFENNSNLNWRWSDDESHLIVEVQEEDEGDALGFGQKTVYTIPRSNINYWGGEERPPSMMLKPHPMPDHV